MKLYRSIGEKELNLLLSENVIYGQYNCVTEQQNTNQQKNICCFFVDEIIWRDSQHSFLIVLDIPDNNLNFGIGEYHAADSLRKTKCWSGRNGKELYHLREAYSNSYNITNVKELWLFGKYASHYVYNTIKPICDKHNIVLHWMDSYEPFKNSTQTFIKNNNIWHTNENTDDWLSKFKTNNKIIYYGNFEEVYTQIKKDYLSNDVELINFFNTKTPDLTIEEIIKLYARLKAEIDGDELIEIKSTNEVYSFSLEQMLLKMK